MVSIWQGPRVWTIGTGAICLVCALVHPLSAEVFWLKTERIAEQEADLYWQGDQESYYRIDFSDMVNSERWIPMNLLPGDESSLRARISLHEIRSHAGFFRLSRHSIGSPLDSDGDGIDDVWKLQHGLDPLAGINPDLDVWLPFDEGSGAFASNRMGDPGPATLTDLAEVAWGDGVFGSAVVFNGQSGAVRMAEYGPVSSAQGFSVSLWARLDTAAVGPVATLLSLTNPCGASWQGVQIQYDVEASTLRAQLSDCVDSVELQVVVGLIDWRHIVLVMNESLANLYVDGNLMGWVGVGLELEQADIWLGNVADGTLPWHGKIDDVRLYSRGLSGSAIAAMRQAFEDWSGDGLVNADVYRGGGDPHQYYAAPKIHMTYPRAVQP